MDCIERGDQESVGSDERAKIIMRGSEAVDAILRLTSVATIDNRRWIKSHAEDVADRVRALEKAIEHLL